MPAACWHCLALVTAPPSPSRAPALCDCPFAVDACNAEWAVERLHRSRRERDPKTTTTLSSETQRHLLLKNDNSPAPSRTNLTVVGLRVAVIRGMTEEVVTAGGEEGLAGAGLSDVSPVGTGGW